MPRTIFTLLVGAFLLTATGCDRATDVSGPVAPQETADAELAVLLGAHPVPQAYPAPAPLVVTGLPGHMLEFWPYTGQNFSGEPQDPINLVFMGQADPRDIRAALLALDGDRSAFGLPPVSPFNDLWQDAIGDVQTAYGTDEEWAGGAVQLTCGPYGPVRFHLRLFRLGDWTVGNAHFEVLIEGTTDHQVLSWELAEQFVLVDFMRTSLLDGAIPMFPTGPINQPDFRAIPAQIYNLLPVELRALIEGPLGDVGSDVPIKSDGSAMVLNLAGSVPWTPGVWIQDFVLPFDQTIPKPFCAAGPTDYVYVTGNVHLVQTTELSTEGTYQMAFSAQGELNVQPINPFTGEPVGGPLSAVVREQHAALMGDASCTASSWLFQRLLPFSDTGAGSLFKHLQVGDPGAKNFYREAERCATANLATVN
jgi:hypothetical protein